MRTRGKLVGALALVGAMGLGWAAGPGPAWAQDAWPAIRSDFREGRFDGALARLEALISANPSDKEAWYYVALIRWRQGRMTEATEAYRRVAALDPGGPFGQDAAAWLRSYVGGMPSTPTPTAMATEAPSLAPSLAPATPPPPRPTPSPSWAPPSPPPPRPTPAAVATPGWLAATPAANAGGRPRSRNPRPGFFKALDGTFEFKPPQGFALLDEGETEGERRTLFGPANQMQVGPQGEQPPSLLFAWREVPPGRPEAASLRAEASSYGQALPAQFMGGEAFRVLQRQGAWQAETWLMLRHHRLYAVTFGGDAKRLAAHRGAVLRALGTATFYP